MKHKTKNRLIKKRKGRKTKKMKMRRGGGLFTSFKFGIPGFGSAGTCPDQQYKDPVYGWIKATCYQVNGHKFYKREYPDSDEVVRDKLASTKPWYQFW
jgi:hypothetical protein